MTRRWKVGMHHHAETEVAAIAAAAEIVAAGMACVENPDVLRRDFP